MDAAWIWLGVGILLVVVIGSQVYTVLTYQRYRRRMAEKGHTGAQVARALLNAHGLEHVAVEEVKGFLSDGYDLKNKAVRLSTAHFASPSLAALGIAAHETGHALQAGEADGRRSVNPFVSPRAALMLVYVASWLAVLAGAFLTVGWLSRWDMLLSVGAVLFLWSVTCSLLTLPVEMNASRRALVLLRSSGFVAETEVPVVRAVLRAAVLAYVSTAVSALMQVFRGFLRREA